MVHFFVLIVNILWITKQQDTLRNLLEYGMLAVLAVRV